MTALCMVAGYGQAQIHVRLAYLFFKIVEEYECPRQDVSQTIYNIPVRVVSDIPTQVSGRRSFGICILGYGISYSLLSDLATSFGGRYF